jgi:hypothetical protein
MRRVPILLLFTALSSAAFGQDRPPKLEPLPEAPPPPVIRDGAEDARVRIAPPTTASKEEPVPGGIKVTPGNGLPPYYLMETTPGEWVRRDTLDPGVRVPMWTIMTFD